MIKGGILCAVNVITMGMEGGFLIVLSVIEENVKIIVKTCNIGVPDME